MENLAIYKLSAKILLILLIATTASAELGNVDPQDWGAKFDPKSVKSGIFCIRYEDRPNECATGVLISKLEGLILTANHVISEELSHPQVFYSNKIAGFPLKQKLMAFNGESYAITAVAFPDENSSDRSFIENPFLLRKALISQGNNILNFDIRPFINSDVYKNLDVAVVKIANADLAKFVNQPYRELKIKDNTPVPGERVFLASFPWSRYPLKYFEQIKSQGLNPAAPKNRSFQDGNFGYQTGTVSRVVENSVVTEATDDQLKRSVFDNSALDTFKGSSGGAMVDKEGHLLGIHWSSDSSLPGFQMRSTTISIAVLAKNALKYFNLELQQIPIK